MSIRGWLDRRRDSEVVDEFEHYNDVARSAEKHKWLADRLTEIEELNAPWGHPSCLKWAESEFDSVAQVQVYSHVADLIDGGVFVQVGGTGLAAVKALLAGASRAYLVSPVLGEAELTQKLAIEFGVADRFRAVEGSGESMSLGSDVADVVISEACLHHMDVPRALAEMRRVLKPGGRFGAFDPWHARLYDLGTGLFGKRDRAVDCRPLNSQRMAGLTRVFPKSSVQLHSPVSRYGFIVLSKARIHFPIACMYWVTRFEDWLCRPFAFLRRNGSSAAVLAEK